jgi:hypothetical protein
VWRHGSPGFPWRFSDRALFLQRPQVIHRGRLAVKTEVGLDFAGRGRETRIALLFFNKGEYFLLPLGKHVIRVPVNTIK